MSDEIQIGPLFFAKEDGSGMSVHNGDETLGYCEGVWPETWDEFVAVVERLKEPA